ncbi:lytic polysaccharide monooxygenase [Sphaerobolus stellatus SS14]|uniref:AA9 family lytic polysaccharide monooxygenase n=1 Tax=Sphaerobolus stellatus (strain SS14) TaxID=990650 RepID=A0A0C9UQR8_SPHS4|nr:lytic polysaccharide monooxygenase [Sphaerobolus stellatus SS14]
MLTNEQVINIYMVKTPSNVAAWDGSSDEWFKVHKVPTITNGSSSLSFPTQGINPVIIPLNLPDGQYLVCL